MMPVMDGPQFCARWAERRSMTGDHIPVVLISADRGVRERAQSLGADGYLTKPFDIDDIVRVVEHHAHA